VDQADADGPLPGSSPRAAILLVDDHPANLTALAGTLSPLGHRLVTASSGREAIQALAVEEFALVLLDVQMPELGGFATATLMRDNPRTAHVPIIFVTALERDAPNVFEGYARGAVDYLLKPLDPAILRSKVQVFVSLFLKEKDLEARALALVERERRDLRRKNQAYVENLLDSMPLCLWALRPDGGVDYCNRSWTLYSGLPAGTADPMRHVALIHPDDRPLLRQAWMAALARGAPFETECRLRARDGSYRWHIGRIVPERDETGRLSGWIATATDIDSQKTAEAQIARMADEERQAREEADAANRAKDEFLATLSHELRTPLGAMIGWTRLLRAGNLTPDRARRALETIERNAKAQAELIDDILDVSRIVTGKLRLDVQPVDLGAIATEALDAIQPAADAKGIEMVSRSSIGLERMAGDPARLRQVLINLLSNAIKFTPRGGRVELILDRLGPTVRMRVRDNGRGITPAFTPFVFDRFRQLDGSSTRAHGGLGLGLAIVRHLVELHAGTVSVHSDGEGSGSTFTVTLPFREAETAADLPAAGGGRSTPPTPIRAPAAVDLGGIKVLLVDDEPDARELLSEVLEQYGAQVIAVASAGEALAALRAQRPHVLVSDIGLPGEDGYSLMQRVRALPVSEGGATPAAALTAYARSEDSRRALAAGFVQHAVKPIQPAVLAALVRDLAAMNAAPDAAAAAPPGP